MMVIVGVLRQTGVFEYLAIWSAKRAKARPFRMMVVLVLITAVASALLDNVTTVLLIAPVTLLVCERLGVNPVPYLLAEVMASNIGGAATLIGDPPNIIIASRSGLSFNDFLVNLGPIVVILLVVFIGLAWVLLGPQDELRRRARRARDGAGGARGDHRRTAPRPHPRRARARPGRVRDAPGHPRRTGRRRDARSRPGGRPCPGSTPASTSPTWSGRRSSSSPGCSSWSGPWSRSA